MADITQAQTEAVLAAAAKAALEQGTAMNIAVVDAGANLKGFTRMDGAWLGSIDIAIRKARTARYFDMPTGSIGELSQPGGVPSSTSKYPTEDSLRSPPAAFPLYSKDGHVIGAVGVSGSTVENDHAVASAGGPRSSFNTRGGVRISRAPLSPLGSDQASQRHQRERSGSSVASSSGSGSSPRARAASTTSSAVSVMTASRSSASRLCSSSRDRRSACRLSACSNSVRANRALPESSPAWSPVRMRRNIRSAPGSSVYSCWASIW